MTHERWQEIIERVKKQSPQVESGQEPLPDGVGHREYIELQSALGRMRLELWVRPRVLEKKTLYSHRMHSAATVQYKYDDNEQTLTLHAYRWNEAQNDWQEVGVESLAAGL
ncbi:MAG: hypothetical protein UV57_C0011G0010 [Parcubacteria group bacterium GW2011_GWD2_43_10]|uniref:Uncharacterized protein n=4 Tax=Candidatus Vebleniibacteriota TaxID=1817921 RepID=A0A1G2Q3A6_9BACT|nr:MAG: hypothetical protein UV47_C0001G0013 [Parcubacteria group bacterium GW2011_GWA2_42_80]KKS79150.1 MAG: hypothetical protein UV52_C0016G0007 [Parcubacteria group bacterium GW2011_GWD1_42_9]KKS83554.1 MAG: hypothetical protein UV57_C0011G0010 [Parcubacteria group bacterium GW2011_GWD2_43_10]KKS93995.1 MAG: hypothetical protein UV69_C0002G0006 [Parcubacteria group bacterium GW2011_GWE2_43_12]KKT14254.1 MAG: hypothetical protein UV92_C0003G0020 [Parcubacteria group bacterium GW2011_GWA1_43_2